MEEEGRRRRRDLEGAAGLVGVEEAVAVALLDGQRVRTHEQLEQGIGGHGAGAVLIVQSKEEADLGLLLRAQPVLAARRRRADRRTEAEQQLLEVQQAVVVHVEGREDPAAGPSLRKRQSVTERLSGRRERERERGAERTGAGTARRRGRGTRA
jgi:hypothetical protein